eukprot:evm.model.scf_542.4 EVM.evm.TU.scf_542.4   scf_542:38728-40443(+)
MASRQLLALVLVIGAIAANGLEVQETVATGVSNSASRKMLSCGSIPLCCQTYDTTTCSCAEYRPGAYWDELKGCVTVAYDDDGDIDYDDGTIFDHIRVRLSNTLVGRLVG